MFFMHLLSISSFLSCLAFWFSLMSLAAKTARSHLLFFPFLVPLACILDQDSIPCISDPHCPPAPEVPGPSSSLMVFLILAIKPLKWIESIHSSSLLFSVNSVENDVPENSDNSDTSSEVSKLEFSSNKLVPNTSQYFPFSMNPRSCSFLSLIHPVSMSKERISFLLDSCYHLSTTYSTMHLISHAKD